MRFSGIANFITFVTPPSATFGGKPVNAQATFTTANGFASVTIVNFQANPTSIIQAISDLSFDLSNVTSGTLTSSVGQERNIAGDGTFTDGNSVSTGWALSKLVANLPS